MTKKKKKNLTSKSEAYWINREVAHSKMAIKDDKKALKGITALYRDTSREIEKEVNTMLTNYAGNEGLSMSDVKKRITKTDITDFDRKAKRYVKEKNFSPRANQEMALYNLKMRTSRLELMQQHIDLELTALTDGTEKLVYDRLYNVSDEEIKRQAGILGEGIRVNKEDIDYIARRRFHGDNFSQTLWTNKKKLHAELDKRLTESLIKGQNPRVSARKLRDEVDSSIYNSERLMFTESSRVQSESQMLSYEKLEIEEYIFITTEGHCDICGQYSDEVFKVKDGMAGSNLPPLHPNCHCSTAGYVGRDEDKGTVS